jgi:hypothetical protein
VAREIRAKPSNTQSGRRDSNSGPLVPSGLWRAMFGSGGKWLYSVVSGHRSACLSGAVSGRLGTDWALRSSLKTRFAQPCGWRVSLAKSWRMNADSSLSSTATRAPTRSSGRHVRGRPLGSAPHYAVMHVFRITIVGPRNEKCPVRIARSFLGAGKRRL